MCQNIQIWCLKIRHFNLQKSVDEMSFGGYYLLVVAREQHQSKDMRKCRNWQTSKTKDLVAIAVVRVQVPPSA